MQLLIDYLKNNSFDKLAREYGILVRNYNDELYNLTYTDYLSPKFNPLVELCRGTVIDKDLNVLARPFDRFYNYNENPNQQPFDFSNSFVFDKVDGSLIKVWWYPKEQRWCVGTKGTAFCEMSNPYDKNFKKLVYESLNVNSDDEFNSLCNGKLEQHKTHLFEITSPFNRVVLNYSETKLHYLNSRDIVTGEYSMLDDATVLAFGAELVNRYNMNSIHEMHDFNNSLTTDYLLEGFIICDSNYKPTFKLKAELYMKMHYLRGDELTHRRMVYMLIRNDYGEYLTYFPDDKVHFERYFKTWDYMIDDLNKLNKKYAGYTPRQISESMGKDFRVAVPVEMVNFDGSLNEFLCTKLESYRYKLFMKYFGILGYVV